MLKISLDMKRDLAAFGVYKTQKQAERALAALEEAGYDPANVAMLLPHSKSHDFAYLMSNNIATGAFIGAILGIIFGTLIGYFVAGQLYIESPGLAALLGAVFGCAAGASAGALVGVGTPHSLRNRYIEYLREGGVILAVHDDGTHREKSASAILEETGASDVHELDEKDTWRSLMDSASAFVRVRQGRRRLARFFNH